MSCDMPLAGAGSGGGTGGGVIAAATVGNTTVSASSSSNPRKRQRTLVSCTECHRRKQKCDRQWPCGNCTSRSASHLCQYERKTKRDENSSSSHKTGAETANTDDSGGDMAEDSESELESMRVTRTNTSAFGYTMGVQNTSLNVLEKLDIGCDNQLHPVYSDRTFQFTNPNDLHTYNNFIRLIPARPFTNLLVQVFFTEVNFFYGMLHQPTFNRLLDEWWAVATEKINNNTGEQGGRGVGSDPYISKDIHFFPSLLLQVLSSAIQLLPREHHEYISQIKLGMFETLPDFSIRLSNASCELATLLGGTCTTSMSRVVQPFLRASWLKNEGRMHESWHALGTAIRSAQEQGFHLQNGPNASSSGSVLRGMGGGAMRSAGPNSIGEQYRMMWYKEMEKRVWINLYLWDRYISMVLGRPTMINDRHCTVTMPVDCEPPADFTSQEPIPRGVMDPPSTFTQRILDYRISLFVNEVEELTQAFNTTSTPDFVRLDSLHAKLMGFTESFPPELSITNRNTAYDDIRPFLAIQATLLKSTFFSVIIALHRPYLFLREKSRKEIVRAGLVMLECQDTLVKILKEHHHRIYAICFFTFDPCVLLSAVIITNCKSLDQETVEKCLVALRAGWRRLRMLGVYLRLAEKGSVVIRVLLRKVEAVVEGMRWSNSAVDDVTNDTTMSEPASTTATGSNKSPRSLNPGVVGNGKNTRRSRSNTRGNGGSRKTSPRSQYSTSGLPSPQNTDSSTSVSSPDHHSTHEHQPSPNLPESAFIDAINAASSFNGHHHNHQQHHLNSHGNQHHQHPSTAAATTPAPLVWDNSVLIDVSGSVFPSTTTTTGPLLHNLNSSSSPPSSGSTFDFSKSGSSSISSGAGNGGGGGGFPGFFDGAPAFPMGSSALATHHHHHHHHHHHGHHNGRGDSDLDGLVHPGVGGVGVVGGIGDGEAGSGASEDWAVPSADGLWQNLLGIFEGPP